MGDGDFCTVKGACAVGEGDCDGNQQCQSGLVCHNNVGENYGFASFTDGCEPPVLGSTNYCTVTGACGEGEGDCDSNDESEVGLACRNDIGADYGFLAFIDVWDPYSGQQRLLFCSRALWGG